MPTRVTKYLGGTGVDNTNKLNVHPTLNKVSIGADEFGSANLTVFGNTYVSGDSYVGGNVRVLGDVVANSIGPVETFLVGNSTSAPTNFANLHVYREGPNAVANITANGFRGTSRLDFAARANTFSFILSSSNNPVPNMLFNGNVSNLTFAIDNVYFQSNVGVNRGVWNNIGLGVGTINTTNTFQVVGNSTFLGNTFIQGNTTVQGDLIVTGTQYFSNTGVIVSNSNAISSNAFLVTKFTGSDINPSNGYTFVGSNTVLYSYTLKAIEFDRGANTMVHGNIHMGTGIWASNNLLGIGTKGPNATIHTTGNARVGSNVFIGPAFDINGNNINNINTVRLNTYEGIQLTGGTTAQRPASSNGTIRFNNSYGILEATDNGNTWYDLRYRLSNTFLEVQDSIGRPNSNMFLGTGTTAQNKVYVFRDPVLHDSTITEIRAACATTGTFPIRIFDLDEGSNTYTQSGPDHPVTLPSTATVHVLNSNSYGEIFVRAGQYIGLHNGGTSDNNGKISRSGANVADGKGYVTSGTGNVSSFSNSITVITSSRLEIGFTLTRTANTSGELEVHTDLNSNNFNYFESQANIGRPAGATLGGTTTTGNTTYIFQAPVVKSGRVFSIRANVLADGNMYLKRYSRGVGNAFTQISEHLIQLELGKSTYRELDYGYIPVNAGDYLGFFAHNRIAYTTSGGTESNGHLTQANCAIDFNSSTYVTAHRIELGLDIMSPVANLNYHMNKIENNNEHLIWGDTHSKMFTYQVPGAPEYRPVYRTNVISTYGRVAQVKNSSNTVASVSPLYVDPDKLIQVTYKVQRESVSAPASNTVVLGISWLDQDYAVLSNTVVENIKDLPTSNVLNKQVIVSSRNSVYSDFISPENAVYMNPYVDVAGTTHVTHVVQLDKNYLDMTDSRVDLFDGLRTNLAVALGTYRLVKGYVGPLFKLVRDADNATRDFYSSSNGYPNISEIKNWLNSNVGYVLNVYDQATSRRHGVSSGAASTMPRITFPGLVPAIVSIGSGHFDIGNSSATTGPAAGVTYNVSNVSMVMQRINLNVNSVNSPRAMIAISRNGSGVRAGLYFTGSEQGGLSANSSVGGRRLDADSTVIALGIAPSTETWQVHAGALDYSANTAHVWAGNRKQTTTNFFAAPGNTSSASSTTITVGALIGAWTYAGVFTHALNDDEVALINHRSVDLNNISNEASHISLANWSWYNYPFTNYHNNVLYTGFTDLRGHQYIHTKPGTVTEIANVCFEAGQGSDHLAPTITFLPDGRLFTAYTGHALNNNLYYRLSTNEQVENLGPQIILTQSSAALKAEYNQVFPHSNSNSMSVWSQAGDQYWGVHVCNDTNRPDLVFNTFQNIVYYSGTTIYQYSAFINQNELITYPHISPNSPNNNVYIYSCNVITGNIFTTGNTYGYWNGAAGSTTLPVQLENLPKIWTINNGDCVRVLDILSNGTAFLSGRKEQGNVNANVMLVLSRFTGSNIYSEASWTHSNVAALGGYFEAANDRFGGACFGNDPHTGVRIYASINVANRYKLVRFDSTAGDGSDWTSNTMTYTSNNVIAMPHSPVNATPEEPVWFREIVLVDGVTNSKGIGVLVNTRPTNQFQP